LTAGETKMENTSKLKPIDEHGPLVGLLLSIIMITAFAIIWNIYGENTVDKIAGILLAFGAVLNFLIWYRTKSPGHLSFMSWQLLMAIRLLFGFEDPVVVTVYAVMIIILILIFFYMIYKKKLKSYYKNILELAAQPVEDAQNGFTARPFPAGRTEFRQHEIIEFGKYCAKNLIAIPYLEKGKLILVISVNFRKDLLFTRNEYLSSTYVAFNQDGSVEVNIAENEYRIYREELTFDQLCASLGNLFIEFLNLFKENKSKEILNRLNSI
jgi:hypothetical protein